MGKSLMKISYHRIACSHNQSYAIIRDRPFLITRIISKSKGLISCSHSEVLFPSHPQYKDWYCERLMSSSWGRMNLKPILMTIFRLYERFIIFPLGVGFANLVLKNCMWNVHLLCGKSKTILINEPRSQQSSVCCNSCFVDITKLLVTLFNWIGTKILQLCYYIKCLFVFGFGIWLLYVDVFANTHILLNTRHHILLEVIGYNNDINSLFTSLFARVKQS